MNKKIITKTKEPLMSKKLRIALAQLNLKVGDIEGNLKKLIQAANTARDTHQCDIIVFPELSITGYPPEDLLLRPSFLKQAEEALNTFKTSVNGIHCVIGHTYQTAQGLYNACSMIYNGAILGHYNKEYLPNYGIFDECRYFLPGDAVCVVPVNGIPIGMLICEDLWHASPIQQAAAQGARLILSPNASPFEVDKHERRCAILSKRANSVKTPIIYVNCVGGQDEIVFDGGSLVFNQEGELAHCADFCQEALLPVDIEFSASDTKITMSTTDIPNEEKRIYDCLVLGVRDYLHKNNFKSVLIGVSGGIDSALTLAIAVDALGKENVTAVFMPSRYTATISKEDADELVNNMGVAYQTIPIEPIFTQFLETLAPSFTGTKPNITEENVQSRCRGVILMALSNKFGHLVLSTGNRSEFAVGYTTLYGDTVGALSVLKDVSKTMVYRLSHYRNQINTVIPNRIIDRPPTAELAPDQKDEDTLPPYPILDKILHLYLNEERGIDNIIAQGFDQEIVKKIVKMIKQNEYKRRQAPIGIHIHHKSFIRDWRYPITSGFKN